MTATAIKRFALRAFDNLMPDRAAAWLENAMLTPYPVRPPDVAEPASDRAMRRIPYGTGWLAVSSWGEGPTVLLHHGWGGTARSLNAYVDPLVEAGYRVVSYDAPAHGASPAKRTNLIDCSGAALQVSGTCGPVHAVVAHSFGGIVTSLAARFGMGLDRAVLLGSPLSIYEQTVQVADGFGIPRTMTERMAERFARRLDFEWQRLRTDALVAELNVPFLVVHDEDDRIVPYSDGVRIAAAAADSRLFTTRGLGHRGILADSGVIEAVVGFIREGAHNRVPHR